MNTKKATKRALLTSVMALVMCVVMLVGTTFAWFTDTASTNVNRIVAGNLKVDIVDKEGTTHLDTLKFTKAEAETDKDTEDTIILWEPGCRYVTEGFRIKNAGNLALKWKAEINKGSITDGKVENSAIAKDGKSLLDVIDFYVVTYEGITETEVAIEDFVGNLKKDETSGVYYIKAVMRTTAGNDYQDLTLEGITITVYATQDTVESDSFDDQYDKNANVTLVTPETAETAFKSAGGDHVRNASGTYVLTPGVYSLSTFNFCGTEPVTLVAEKGVKFTGDTIAVTYQSKSIKDGDTAYTVEQKGSLTVIGFNTPNSVLCVAGDAPSITVKGNTVKALRVEISNAAKDIVVENNTFSGNVTDKNMYNAYVVANTSNYDLTVKENTFAGAGSHALHVQGNNGCANSITVTGNTFSSYGENKAAFKIWGDTKYAPAKITEGNQPNDAAQALAKDIETNNTFAPAVKDSNHYVADFYDGKVSFTSTSTNP